MLYQIKYYQLLIIFLFSGIFNSYALDKEITESYKCIAFFSFFEQRYKLPSDTLHSISLQESGKKHSIHGMYIPWPWTVNVGGQGYYFKNKQEAIKFVQKKIAAGKENIDVGCMQINLRYHIDAFTSLEEAFEPANNIHYAAKFLKEKYKKVKNWSKAIAHYHSSTNIHGNNYQRAVFKIANNIDHHRFLLKKYLYNSKAHVAVNVDKLMHKKREKSIMQLTEQIHTEPIDKFKSHDYIVKQPELAHPRKIEESSSTLLGKQINDNVRKFKSIDYSRNNDRIYPKSKDYISKSSLIVPVYKPLYKLVK